MFIKQCTTKLLEFPITCTKEDLLYVDICIHFEQQLCNHNNNKWSTDSGVEQTRLCTNMYKRRILHIHPSWISSFNSSEYVSPNLSNCTLTCLSVLSHSQPVSYMLKYQVSHSNHLFPTKYTTTLPNPTRVLLLLRNLQLLLYLNKLFHVVKLAPLLLFRK